jgi:multidrug efflux pump
MLDRIFLSAAAGNASGSAQTQYSGAIVSGVTPYAAIATNTASTGNALNANAEANAVTNSISNSKGGTSTGSADSTSAETMVPLTAMATHINNHTATQVSHQNGLVASTISFNLPEGGSLSKAQATIQQTMHDLGMPSTIHGGAAGAGQVFNQNLVALPLLLLAAFGAIYIVLGVLYENTIHPITILSTLPSAMVGATLALLIFDTPLSVIAFIGVILLIGIVKKNGIMMIDFAIHMQREQKMEPQQAIHDAAVVRLRPIMMTTFAAVLGALPLAIGIGQGASLRQPLGITVIGGLILSQIITLYTTPVIYLWFERLRVKMHTWYNNRNGQGELSESTL